MFKDKSYDEILKIIQEGLWRGKKVRMIPTVVRSLS